MRQRRFVRLTAMAALLGLASTACGGGSTGSGGSAAGGDGHGTLKVGVAFALDSWETLDKPNTTYLEGVFEGLVALEADGIKVAPRLATEWTQTPTELKFTLRPGVVFHDGTPFDAEAVKVNLERVRDTPSGLQPLMEPVSSVDVVDPTHVTLKLKHQAPTLVQQLARRGGLMLSAKSIKDGTYKTRPAGTGPYMFNEQKSVKGAKVVYDLFPRYWDNAAVGPHSLVLQYIGDDDSMVNALTTGQVDVATVAAAAQKRVESAGFKTLWYPALRYHFLFFDQAKTFADTKVRQAVCYALDPKAIVAAQYENLGETYTQRFSEGQPGYNPDVKGYQHDVAKAKELLAQAGNPNIAINFPIFTSQANLGELVRSQLGAAGIQVTVERMSTAQYFTTYDSGKYPAAYNTSTEEDTGPLDYYRYHLAPNAPDNKYKVAHPDLDSVAQQSLTETDPAKQNELWQKMTKIIHDDALDCGYMSLTIVFAWNTKKVTNVVPTRFQPSVFRYAEAKANG
ncbi:ABC transporter substrate-binding protein [Actinocrispum wychmicini]|uniref:Peptide/nickel transport system substrate-binding protein n=1 Tax=Actinocrispum wychmicini TaxID=1213861 RepID=A0A4R2J4S8_9PSEU|nr:ABC transporter substrate-binding protein [Actinocrispum wychmicini]TCO52272.1 peptide/nickel transport system substrate-binding protein [Actinocrispum wychmicini]